MADIRDIRSLPARELATAIGRFVGYLLVASIVWVETGLGATVVALMHAVSQPFIALLQPLVEPGATGADEFLNQSAQALSGTAKPLLETTSYYTILLAPALVLLLPIGSLRTLALRISCAGMIVVLLHWAQSIVHALYAYHRSIKYFGGSYAPMKNEVTLLSGLNFAVWPMLATLIAYALTRRFSQSEESSHD